MIKRNKFPKRLIFAMSILIFILMACTDQDVADDSTDNGTGGSDAQSDVLYSYTKTLMTDGTTEFYVVENPGDGPRLTYAADSGMDIITVIDGDYEFAFRDIMGTGELTPASDWRLAPGERAAYLAQHLSMEQIAGLGLFSGHQRFPEDGLTNEQRQWLEESHLRNVLNAGPADVENTVSWVNEMQAFVETLRTEDTPLVPVNFATDPRSTAGAATYNAAGGNSRWPSNLGLAATHDITYMNKFARTVTAEYRALGLTTALSPMVELATEPRWLRVEGTLGEDLDWARELAAAYVAGYQGSYGTDTWGSESVNTIIKHFAGDGSNEGGRGAHTVSGMYEVFPGGNFRDRLSVFEAGLASAGLMTGYAVSVDGDGEPIGESRGVAFDGERMDILREEWGWDGVVVTDWGVSRSQDDERPGRAWYMEGMNEAEIMFEAFRVGVDMFGGNNNAEPVLEAVDIWQERYEAGELPIDAETRFRETGRRVLTMLFQIGLYESPFLVVEESLEIVGSQDKVDAGYAAQLASVVMVRNVDGTISPSTPEDWSEMTVYVPHSYHLNQPNHEYRMIPTWEGPTLTIEILEMYFDTVLTDEVELDDDGRVVSQVAPDLSDVDLVLVGLHSPNNGNQHSQAGLAMHPATGGEEFENPEDFYWYPLSLQYAPYTADGEYVRRQSISGRPCDLDSGVIPVLCEPGEVRENRSYFGNTSRITNEADIHAFNRAVEAVEATGRDIPIITILQAQNPTIPTEFYEQSDAIIIGFGVSHQALLEVALGIHEPSGRLPITFPADMDAVERQLEDISDTEPFVDSQGNAWEFGFGLNFSGPLN
jgi:beta-glucosidase